MYSLKCFCEKNYYYITSKDIPSIHEGIICGMKRNSSCHIMSRRNCVLLYYGQHYCEVVMWIRQRVESFIFLANINFFNIITKFWIYNQKDCSQIEFLKCFFIVKWLTYFSFIILISILLDLRQLSTQMLSDLLRSNLVKINHLWIEY